MNRAIHALGALALAGAGAAMSVAATAGLAFETGGGPDPLVAAVALAVAATGLGYTAAKETRDALRTDGFGVTRVDLGNAAAGDD